MKQNTRMYPNLIFLFVCCINQCEWLSLGKLLLCDLKLFPRCTVDVWIKLLSFLAFKERKQFVMVNTMASLLFPKGPFYWSTLFLCLSRKPNKLFTFFKIIGWRWSEKNKFKQYCMFPIFVRTRSLNPIFRSFKLNCIQ